MWSSYRNNTENQWYNKRISELNSIYDRQKIGCFKDKKGNIKYLTNKTEGNNKKLQIVTENRNNFAMNANHKISRFIISRALNVKAGKVVFGKNPLWKQRVKIGKRNNQNFVNLPHSKLIDMTKYKGEEVGIEVSDRTEKYTSKCSFWDTESVEHHDVYMGKRIHRGLFVASKGTKINSDVQGAYNTLRNVDPRFNVLDIMEGVVAHAQSTSEASWAAQPAHGAGRGLCLKD